MPENIPLLALADAPATIRLSLHVLAAAVFVGGQFTVAGILPTLRGIGGDAPKRVAAAFGRVAWPAYALLVITGFWNIAAYPSDQRHGAYQAVLGAKIALVALAGLSALIHQRAKSRRDIALFGALGGVASIAAVVLGVVLAG
jgi:putative copper export protein